ncbi:3-oxoacyl-ACP synthase [Flavobacteriaceae bacterium]|nr:3-oxoacyl-ACP synthase [Flavobacteriaceae bacterium]
MIKINLFKHCEIELNKKLNTFYNQKKELKQALNSESKSSAGDKHEIGRAMIHLEMEKLGNLITEAEQNFKKLQSIKNHNNNTEVIGLGSAVLTDKANYYISIAVDIYKINSKMFYCISPKSPIGKLLIGKKLDDKIEFNNQVIKIIKIL